MHCRLSITALGLGSVLLVVAFGAAPPPAAAAEMAAGLPAMTEECQGCHDDKVDEVSLTSHSVLDSPGWEDAMHAEGSCVSCHGDATMHLEEGGGEGTIFAFGEEELASAKEERCLACHADTHPRYQMSPHAAAGMACTDCHSIHSSGSSPLLAEHSAETMLEGLPGASSACFDCHGDVVAQFGMNERHRLQEGVLECVSCHDPHAPTTKLHLGGFKQDQCTECHVDKTGPFVFEHGGVRVEGCVACHDPHGSPNRHLLAFQSTAELCYSCHAEVPSFHLGEPIRFDATTNCTNCHSSIHGSNFSPFFLE